MENSTQNIKEHPNCCDTFLRLQCLDDMLKVYWCGECGSLWTQNRFSEKWRKATPRRKDVLKDIVRYEPEIHSEDGFSEGIFMAQHPHGECVMYDDVLDALGANK